MKIVALLFTILLLAGPALAEVVTVAVTKAELRDKAAVSGSKVVATVSLNTPLAVQKTEGRYLQVKDFKGNLGWIHQTLVSQDKAVVIEKDGVNVRKGPGKEEPVAFKAMRGEAYRVLDQQGDWLKIGDSKERTGWIVKSLVWGM